MWPATPFFVDKQRQGFPEAIQLKIKRLRQQVPASKWFTRGINNLQSHFLFKSSSLVLIFFALFSPFIYTCLEVTHSPRAEPFCKKSRERGWNLFRIWNHPKIFHILFWGTANKILSSANHFHFLWPNFSEMTSVMQVIMMTATSF